MTVALEPEFGAVAVVNGPLSHRRGPTSELLQRLTPRRKGTGIVACDRREPAWCLRMATKSRRRRGAR